MSLQGSLDTFALPDVLRLLGATRKTGHLRIDGSRGSGNVWVDTGAVVAADATGASTGAAPVEVVFELLRYPDGAFVFDAGRTTSAAGAPNEVEPLLEEADRLIAEWREVEAVVPSMAAWVTLVTELPRPTVAVQAEQWRYIVAVGGGTSVADLGEGFDLGELAACRAVKGLVEAGLVDVEATFPVVTPSAPVAVAPFALPSTGAELAALAAEDDDDGEGKPLEAPELARQLANLGPEAAQAVAAAASAETLEEREAALASIEFDGEPINRGLLLKFLSSVRS